MTLRPYQPTPMPDSDVAHAIRSISNQVSPTSALAFLECINEWRAHNNLPPFNRLQHDPQPEPAKPKRPAPPKRPAQRQDADGYRIRVLANAKLSVEQVREIRRLLAAGHSQRSLSRRFGLTHSTVWHIANGKSWVGIE